MRTSTRPLFHGLIWALAAYLGFLVIYGTYAWVLRATELLTDDNPSAAAIVTGGGLVATLLPVVTVVTWSRSGRRTPLRWLLLIAFGLSTIVLVLLSGTFNI
jgi:hypothetical protein